MSLKPSHHDLRVTSVLALATTSSISWQATVLCRRITSLLYFKKILPVLNLIVHVHLLENRALPDVTQFTHHEVLLVNSNRDLLVYANRDSMVHVNRDSPVCVICESPIYDYANRESPVFVNRALLSF